MGRFTSIFIRHQKSYVFFLLGLFVLPLALVFQFSPYPVHKIQYVFLTTLLVTQLYFFNDKEFHRKIKSDVTSSLEKEFKNVPSAKEIRARSILIEKQRNLCIAMTCVCIFVLMLIFQEF